MKKVIMAMLVISTLFASSVAFGTKDLSVEKARVEREARVLKARTVRALRAFRSAKVNTPKRQLRVSETAEIEKVHSFDWGVFWDVDIYDLNSDGDNGAMVITYYNEFERQLDCVVMDISGMMEPGAVKVHVEAMIHEALYGTTIELGGIYKSNNLKFANQLEIRERFAHFE